MTCYHKAGDPSCSSHWAHPNNPSNQRNSDLEKENKELRALINSPDADNFEWLDVKDVGKHLVAKIQYPNCKKCAYEGTKILVFFNVKPINALKWRRIDPHFDNKKRMANEAPSPAARFPASQDGWDQAIAFAMMMDK